MIIFDEILYKINANEIFEKINKKIKRIINNLIPQLFQKIDCKNRSEFLAASSKIDKLILNNEGNISNVIQSELKHNLTNEEELIIIKKEVRRLLDCMYTDKTLSIKNGTLRYYLESFVSS